MEEETCQAKQKKRKKALKAEIYDLGEDNDTEEKAVGGAGGGKRLEIGNEYIRGMLFVRCFRDKADG